MTTIDGRILATDMKFKDYCNALGITDPFEEEQKRFSQRCTHEHGYVLIRDKTEEDIEWEKEWEKRRDEYLRLEHTFRLWDMHFYLTWEKFQFFLRHETFTDTSIYLPCDCADRQCALTCEYFSRECPREKEELQTPGILGFEGRYNLEKEGE